ERALRRTQISAGLRFPPDTVSARHSFRQTQFPPDTGNALHLVARMSPAGFYSTSLALSSYLKGSLLVKLGNGSRAKVRVHALRSARWSEGARVRTACRRIASGRRDASGSDRARGFRGPVHQADRPVRRRGAGPVLRPA